MSPSSNTSKHGTKNFIRTSRTFKCPACGNKKGDCAVSIDGDFVLCLNTHRGIRGFRYLGDTKGGACWGMLVVEDANSEQSEHWSQLRLEREQERREAAITSAKGKLEPEEIDKYTHKLAEYYGLSRSHRDNLLARGFTSKQINQLRFFSVTPGERLPALFPANYPGVKSGSLAVAVRAIFMPAYNLAGLIHGGQYRLDIAESGKYRWPLGYKSSHLKNGELPITFVPGDKILSENPSDWIGDNFGNEAFICEGFPKATIAALAFNKLFVGAAGGNFSSSIEQFTNFVITKNIKTINICPDAGDVKNPQVMRRWLRQYEYFKSLNLFVRVFWWGQVDKQLDNDIDELPPETKLSYISWEQFLAYAHEYGGLEKNENWFDTSAIKFGSYEERVKAAQKELEDFLPWTDEIKLQEYINCNIEDLNKGIYIFKSGTNTGKTTLALKIVDYYSYGLVLSYRNSLLQQFCEKSKGKVIHLHDCKLENSYAGKKFREETSLPWIAACVDSSSKLPARKVIILEEVEKTMNHMLRGKTCKKSRPYIISNFFRLIEQAEHIFCFDADVSPITMEYLQAVTGKTIYGTWNQRQSPRWNIQLYGGEKEILSDGSIKEKPNARSGFEEQFINAVLSGENVMLCSDAQKLLVAVDRLLNDYGYDVLRIDSYTKGDPITMGIVNEFLKDPDTVLTEKKPKALLLSPLVESSTDITIPYFSKVFGIFFGIINHKEIMQILARYRQPVERFVYCRTYSFANNNSSRSSLPEVVARNYLQNQQEALEYLAIYNHLPTRQSKKATNVTGNYEQILDSVSDIWQSPHFKAVCQFTAFDNYSKANLRQNLLDYMLEQGHHAVLLDMRNKVTYKKITEEKIAWLKEEAKKICEIPVPDGFDYYQAMKLKETKSLTPIERWLCEKVILQHKLPGFELNEEFVFENHLDNPHYINRLSLRWAMQNLGKQQSLDKTKWVNFLRNDNEIWDIQTRSLQAQLLLNLGVPQLIKQLTTKYGGWNDEDEVVLDFKDICIQYTHRLRRILSINANSNSNPNYLVRRILEKIGVGLERHQHRIKGTNKKKYSYTIDGETLENTNEVTRSVFDAIARRHESDLSSTDETYKKIYMSSQLGTKIIPDLDPLSNPQLINQILKASANISTAELEQIHLNRDEQEVIKFESCMTETLTGCESWEMVSTFLKSYSLEERQIGWALLSVEERNRLARLKI